MAVVLLVRHGQASFGADDYDVLSELGREQSLLVGAELARRRLRNPAVVSGTLRRQRDTATLALPHAQVRADPRFDEYDTGDLLLRYGSPAPAATTSRELQPLLDQALQAWIQDLDGSWPAFSTGAHAALEQVASDLAPGQDAVVFTSGGILAAVTSQLLGAGDQAVVGLNRVVVNAAVTTVVAGGRGPSLVTFNDHAFLPPDKLSYR